jgi:hypothetical protein
MKRIINNLLICCTFLALFTNCATILKTAYEKISIVSQPNQAMFSVYDNKGYLVWNGETPSSFTLNKGEGYFKKATYRVEISKPGFQTMTVYLQARVSGWYLGGNLLFGGFTGWLIVDPITGAMWALNPNNLSIQLSKYDSLTSDNKGLQIFLLSEIDPELLKDKSTIKIQ